MEGEDGDTGLPIGFPINFYGTEYSTVYVNSNGSLAFGAGSDAYDYPLDEILNGAAGVVAYGLDLDNREIDDADSAWGSGRHGDFFYWGRTSFGGHDAFVATWMNILDYSANTSKTNWNTFQIMLVDIDGGAGTDVDIIVNYGSLQANDEGYGYDDGCYAESGNCVAIGVGSVDGETITYASIVDDDGVLYNGKTSSDVADDGPFPLREAHLNNAVAGRFKFQMRDGDLPETAGPPGKPVITDAARGDTTGTVTWSEPADLGGSPVLAYDIRWRAAGDETWSSDSPVSSPHEITGLTNGVTYEVQVSATNGTGTGPWSNSAFFTPGAAGSPEWDDTTIGALTQGDAFSGGVSATGTPAPTYAVTDGELPPGLTLDAATGAITGTPTQRGRFTFTITATNTVGSADWVFTVSVAAMELPPTDTIGAPMPAPGGLNALALLLQVVVATVSVLAIAMRLRPRDAGPRA